MAGARLTAPPGLAYPLGSRAADSHGMHDRRAMEEDHDPHGGQHLTCRTITTGALYAADDRTDSITKLTLPDVRRRACATALSDQMLAEFAALTFTGAAVSAAVALL